MWVSNQELLVVKNLLSELEICPIISGYVYKSIHEVSVSNTYTIQIHHPRKVSLLLRLLVFGVLLRLDIGA